MRNIIAFKAGSFIGLLSALAVASPALPIYAAVPPPGAGSILRDQQNLNKQPRQLPESEKVKEQSATKTEMGALVSVKDFTFSGYEGIATDGELQALVADAKGKTITFGELKALTNKITAHFNKKGWFRARAYLPKQDVTDGIIEIAVIQGASDGSLDLKLDRTARICQNVLRDIGETAVRKGEPLKEKELERSVLLMNDLPGIIARVSMAQGTIPGTTRVSLAVSEGPILSGVLFGDNYGNHYTGAFRVNTTVSINDPFRYGDQVSALLTEAEGLVQGRIGYSLPILVPGLRAMVSYTGMSYELGHEFTALNYKGSSNNVDAGLTYSVVRSRTSNLWTGLSYQYKVLVDTQAGVDISDKQLHSVTLSANGDHYDKFWGGGSITYNVGATTGNLHESIAPTGREGRYTRFNAGLTRVQRLADGVSLNVSGVAQKALDNLENSEQLSLGGPFGIRAYPVGEASGDEGQLVSADLRFNIPLAPKYGTLQASGFFDAGHITLNKDRFAGDVLNDSNRNDYWLQGAGVGFNYIFTERGAVRASWAHVIGNNPGQRLGKNSDGQDDKSRFWLQGEVYF